VSSSGTVTGFFTYADPRVNFSYTLPDGWVPVDMGNVHAPNAVVSWWAVGNVYADGCRWTLQDPPLGPNVDDLANVWGKLPGFTATTPVDITVDGYTGKRVDFTLPDYDKTECVADEFNEGNWFLLWTAPTDAPRQTAQQLDGMQWAWGPEQQNRLWILDVDGTRLVIHEESNPGTTPEQLAGMDQFLASVQIG
jgi:hypothetical protein